MKDNFYIKEEYLNKDDKKILLTYFIIFLLPVFIFIVLFNCIYFFSEKDLLFTFMGIVVNIILFVILCILILKLSKDLRSGKKIVIYGILKSKFYERNISEKKENYFFEIDNEKFTVPLDEYNKYFPGDKILVELSYYLRYVIRITKIND